MNRKTNIRHWHNSHTDWLRALNFYKGELGILGNRLVEVAGKNTSQEVGAQVEHFQNAFVLHLNNIEELEHDIKASLARIAHEIATQTGFVTNELLVQLEKEKQIYLEEEREVNELRHSFNLFAAKWI